MKTIKRISLCIVLFIIIVLCSKWNKELQQLREKEAATKIETDSILEEKNKLIAQFKSVNHNLNDSLIKIIQERDAIKQQIKKANRDYKKYFRLYVETNNHRDSVNYSNTKRLLSKHRLIKLDRNK